MFTVCMQEREPRSESSYSDRLYQILARTRVVKLRIDSYQRHQLIRTYVASKTLPNHIGQSRR